MTESVSIIIPTRCDLQRRELLLRAIDSVVSQEGVRCIPIVVVNGSRFDPGLLARLLQRADVKVIQIEPPGPFVARKVGYQHSATEFFGLLDDDDVLLPGAIARRLRALHDDSSIDWVVTNGIFVSPEGDIPFVADMAAVRRDPCGTLLESCWLSAGGSLFRKAAFDPDTFDAVRSMDLTYIAFRLLAEGRKVAFIDEATYKYFYYPDSLSKQDFYNLPAAEAIQQMAKLALPGWVKRELGRKYRRAMHDVADYYRRKGQRGAAWAAHIRSLSGFPELLRYAGFTRKLLSRA